MKIDIQREDIIFDEFFEIYKADLRFEQFDGSMSKKVTRYSFEKNDAVAVLVYHTGNDEYLLVRQFRYPPLHHDIDPWMVEIVAGGKDEDESAEEAAGREVIEEIGYEPIRLEKVVTCYVSPGLMNERVSIYVAEVDESSKRNNGGGAKGEDEDIEIVRIKRNEAMKWVEDQEVGDAKTIIAMQWHLNRG
jgi:ADP-ribose pyrophosphatase